MTWLVAALRRLHAFMQDGWHVLHVVVLLVPLGFGIVLARPGATFAISTAYRVMGDLMSEGSWAAVSIACGLAGGLALVSRDRNIRSILAAVVATWHGTIALCVGLSTGLTTGSTTYAALSLGAYSLAWNAGRGQR